MKKIFTLIAATFAAISINAQGTTLIEYTCSGPVSADGDDNKYATVASNDNGKIVIGQYDKVCADIAVKEGNTSLPAKPGVMLDGNPSETTTKYVRISLKEPFQAGDVITAKGTTKKSSGNGVVLCQTKANGEGSTIYIDFPRYEETEGNL